MAHRAYLYAWRYGDGSGSHDDLERDMVILGDWRNEVPYAFELLCSVGTRVETAPFLQQDPDMPVMEIRADYAGGVARLMDFLDRLEERLSRVVVAPWGVNRMEVRRQIARTREFFSQPRLRDCQEIALDAEEVFGLLAWDEDDVATFVEERDMLLEDIRSVADPVDGYHHLKNLLPDWTLLPSARLRVLVPAGQLRRGMGDTPAEFMENLGLSAWSSLVE